MSRHNELLKLLLLFMSKNANLKFHCTVLSFLQLQKYLYSATNCPWRLTIRLLKKVKRKGKT